MAAQQADARQRAPVGLARVPRHRHPDPGAAPVLRLPRHRCRPLHHRRPVPPGAARAARTRHRPTARARAPTGSTRPSSTRTATALVLAAVSQITPDGLPVLLIENAPPEVKTKSLKLTRPEIYYGEVTHEPVFVNTAQRRVQLSLGRSTTCARAMKARAAFRSPRFAMRLAAAISEGEPNILLTELPHGQQPHDDPPQRARPLQTLAGFLAWDPDPYLVITDAGRLVWMVDGYTTSDAHPYSRTVDVRRYGPRQLHPQRREGHRGCLRRRDAPVRLRSGRPDHRAYQRPVSRSVPPRRRCPPTCARTRAIPRRCSACRRRSTAPTTCSIRSRSTTRRICGTWRATATAQDGGAEPVDPTYVVATLPGEEQSRSFC